MLISRALAGHGVVDTGSSGGAIALSIILAVAVVFFLANLGLKKWRRRVLRGDGDDESRDR